MRKNHMFISDMNHRKKLQHNTASGSTTEDTLIAVTTIFTSRKRSLRRLCFTRICLFTGRGSVSGRHPRGSRHPLPVADTPLVADSQ